jgi:hypothetical protein
MSAVETVVPRRQSVEEDWKGDFKRRCEKASVTASAL